MFILFCMVRRCDAVLCCAVCDTIQKLQVVSYCVRARAWVWGSSIRLTDVAIGRRHVEHIVPVFIASVANRVCAVTVDEGLEVVYISVTTGEKKIFCVIVRWRGVVHYNRPQE
jgi:hypothetical protein